VCLLSCRQPLPGRHDAFIAAHWKQSVGSLAHCRRCDRQHGMMSAPQKVDPEMAGTKDMAMPMPGSDGIHMHHATPISLAPQLLIVALTLAALAVAVWLMTRLAQIRL
jgi:hypothetical protein